MRRAEGNFTELNHDGSAARRAAKLDGKLFSCLQEQEVLIPVRAEGAQHGRLLADGTPAELMSGVRDSIQFRAPAGLDVAALSTALGAPVVETRPGEYSVATEPAPATVATLTGWLAEHDLPLGDLRAGRQSLEDVFLRLTSDS